MFNAWHDLEYGEYSLEIINAIIEIPKNSNVKYELDKKTGVLKIDRFLNPLIHYPGNYGFIPRTLDEDGDPLDILLLTKHDICSMTLVKVRAIGLIKMIDNSVSDDKIIAVYEKDLRVKDIKDVSKKTINKIKHFFETYKGKKCEIIGVFGKEEAYKEIKHCISLYNKKFK